MLVYGSEVADNIRWTRVRNLSRRDIVPYGDGESRYLVWDVYTRDISVHNIVRTLSALYWTLTAVVLRSR